MSRSAFRLPIALFTLLTAVSTHASVPPAPVAFAQERPLGFTATHAAAEFALESRFDAGLNAGEMRAWLERMASEPNHVSSPHDRANAEFMRDLFQSWGFDTRIETFKVLYPIPKKVALELVAPHASH